MYIYIINKINFYSMKLHSLKEAKFIDIIDNHNRK